MQSGLAILSLDCALHVLALVVGDARDNKIAAELRKKNLSTDDAPDILGQLYDDVKTTAAAIMASRERRALLKTLCDGVFHPLPRAFAIRWSNMQLVLGGFAEVAGSVVGCDAATFASLVGCKPDAPGEWAARFARLKAACANRGGHTDLRDIIALLRPAENWTRVLQGNYITMSLVVPMVLHLQMQWSPASTSSMTQRAQYVARQLLQHLNERLGYVLNTPNIYLAATFLDPATNPVLAPTATASGPMRSQHYAKLAVSYLHTLAQQLDPGSTTQPAAPSRRGNWMDEGLAASLGAGSTLTVTVDDTPSHKEFQRQIGGFMGELQGAIDSGMTAQELYAERPKKVIKQGGEDVRMSSDDYEIIRCMGRQILQTPAHNADSERAASDGGDVMTPERSCTSAKKTEAHLMLNWYYRSRDDDGKARGTGATVGARAGAADGGAAVAAAAAGGAGAAGGASSGSKRKKEAVTVDSLLKSYMSQLPPLSLAAIAEAQDRLLDEHVFEIHTTTGSIEFTLREAPPDFDEGGYEEEGAGRGGGGEAPIEIDGDE